MRCKNCGWINPDTAEECEKCHSRLKPLNNPNRPSATRPDGKIAPKRNNGLKATIMNFRPDLNPVTPNPVNPEVASGNMPEIENVPKIPQPTRIALPEEHDQIDLRPQYAEAQYGAFSLQPITEDGTPYDEPLLINEGDIVVIGNERFLFTRVK